VAAQGRILVHHGAGRHASLPDELLVAYRLDEPQGTAEPGLARAQHVPLPPCLQVRPGQLESVSGGRHCLQPRPSAGAWLRLGEQQAQAGDLAPADPTAELVQLRDPESVRVQTSTPTSMTVVATSTWSRPDRNASNTSCLDSVGTRPCSRPTSRPASGPVASRSKVASADEASSFGESSTRGHTTKAR